MYISGLTEKVLQFPAQASLFLSARKHTVAFTLTRGSLITERILATSAVLALLTLLFIIIDVTCFPAEISHPLAIRRVLTSMLFAMLSVSCSQTTNISGVYIRLFALFTIPVVFLFSATDVLNYHHTTVTEQTLNSVYDYSPFVIASGIGLFPLTILETLFLLALPLMLETIISVTFFPDMLVLDSGFSIVWVLLPILSISILSAVSRLTSFLRLFADTSNDGLTGFFSRKVGEALLHKLFQIAARQNVPFSILFLDLDHFKKINDRFGHDVGDKVLKEVANHLKKILRRQDIAIRWGGEEFLIALPNTDIKQVKGFMLRLVSEGFGICPDGTRVTGSVGVAEYHSDNLANLKDLINLADKRVYMAKEAGRNRCVFQDAVYEIFK